MENNDGKIMLLENERVEDLLFNGLRIIQTSAGYRFTTDSVLLADFVRAKKTDRAVELCSGSGVISLLVNGRTGANMLGIELDGELVSMSNRSAAMNAQHDVRFLCMDLCDAHKSYNGEFDVAVCNPPYFEAQGDTPHNCRNLSIFQLTCTLADCAICAKRLLKNRGRFYVCYPASKLAELMCVLRENRLEPKRVTFVAPAKDKPPYLLLVEAVKCAHPGASVEFICREA